jgi:hypothetical protein
MPLYKREYPLFSLCGLNCGLCPRYQTEGSSKCPGCGGENFHLKHPSCAVISCSKKHGDIEYCFLCEDYPCERYAVSSGKDSFITYKNVLKDMRYASERGLDNYKSELNFKVSFLERLISDYNDGRKKGLYCLAVNLLDVEDLKDIEQRIESIDKAVSLKEQISLIEAWLFEKAKIKNIELKLRK